MNFPRLILGGAALFLLAAAYRAFLVRDISHNPRKYAEEFNLCFMCRNCPQQCPVADTFPRHKYSYKEAEIYGQEEENPLAYSPPRR